MIKIIPEDERKWMSRKEVDCDYDGYIVTFDNIE